MRRAAILIGVQKPATLPELSAVWSSVAQMKQWAESQEIECTSLTDEDGPKNVGDVLRAVREAIDPEKRVQQLFVYFSGHGVNKNYSEFWLLSEANENPNDAINVDGSIRRAQYCGVPHVVFISDACRTAVDNLQAAGITGGLIFPNLHGRPAIEVDQFYATQLGEPAFEFGDPHAIPSDFNAIYTHVMVEALRGEHRGVVERDDRLGKQVVRARPLKGFLASELPKRVYRLTAGENPRSQKPDAIIQSHAAWLSELTPPLEPIPVSGEEPDPEADAHSAIIVAGSNQIADVTRRAIGATRVIDIGDITEPSRSVAEILDAVWAENKEFLAQVRKVTASFPETALATQCGFQVCNTEITSWSGHNFQGEISTDAQWLMAEIPSREPIATLLGFSNGYYALLPAVGGFVATLHFQGDRLVDVAYEPAVGTKRWASYQPHKDYLRQLRAIVSASLRLRPSAIDVDGAKSLADRAQLGCGLDISLAMYAAVAGRNLHMHERIKQLAQAIHDEFGFVMFDLALLAGRLQSKMACDAAGIRPALPLLAPTWSLVPALEVDLPVPHTTLQRQLHPSSLWTLYNDEGATLLAPLIESGEIR